MNEKKITIWEERIHACQNSDLTVAAWCREHQISVATYYYWRKRVSANDWIFRPQSAPFPIYQSTFFRKYRAVHSGAESTFDLA